MNILAIGPHPDDIEIGCGGTLIKYGQAGHAVSLMILTDGGYGAEPDVRKAEQEQAVKLLGGKGLYWAGYRDTELHCSRELIHKIDAVIAEVKPDIVFLNFWADVHQDHRAAAQAAVSATRYIKEVMFYEVPSTQHFEPDIFVDIGDVLDKKLELLRTHASQVDRTRVENLSILESAQACAVFRGFQGRVKFAEGFKAVRMLREIR
ncbi:MAG: PIG-L family deacetylase [Candidatus Omnitrophica bacterium]|nr:PIG-L family deacetylase [Candidatus Omnitrophota bacterium]MDD5775270.1 PIG-L family deacetylase [Candidatus Omnitrophota bacterium]